MIIWILTITMTHGQVEYGYKFTQKSNCEKVGKDLVKMIRQGFFKCKPKNL